MNANELADKLSQFGEGAVFAGIKLTDVATMLRQQQAEIDELKVTIGKITISSNLTDEEIDSVIHELRQKSFDPKRWVDVYTIAIETIIQLRDELRKAQEK
jgi:hypothetical protein